MSTLLIRHYMNKRRLLFICIGLLVLLNIGLMSFLLMGPSPPPRGPGKARPGDVIMERLRFDKEQKKDFHSLIQEHKQKEGQVLNEIKKRKSALYESLSRPANQAFKDSLIVELAEYHALLEEVQLEHFQGIRALCREDQLPLFDELSKELSRIFSAQRPGPPPRRRKKGPRPKD